jgi:hypothetical protein
LCSIYTQSVFSAVFLYQKIGKKAQQNRTVPACLFRDCLLSLFSFFSLPRTQLQTDRAIPQWDFRFLLFLFVQERADKHKELRSASGTQNAMHAGIRTEERKNNTEGHKPKKTIQYGKSVT